MRRKRLRFILVGLIVVLGAISLWKVLPRWNDSSGIPWARMANQQEYTPLASPTDLPPTPTETLPPPQELPTPGQDLPVLEKWTGAPTYAAESTPGYFFQVDFAPALWALTEDEIGNPALVHREIDYCKIIPTGGRGIPRDWSVDHQFRPIGVLQYDVATVSQNGVVQFVNYFGGDGTVSTGFQVSVQDRQQECLLSAETVLATLSSVIDPDPTPTPTATAVLNP